MQGKTLRPVGNIQPLHQHGFDPSDTSRSSQKLSAVVTPQPARMPDKENWPLRPICLTPVLPGDTSIDQNSSHLLPQSGTPFLTSTPERPEWSGHKAGQPQLLSHNEHSAFRPLPDRSLKNSSSLVDYIDIDTSGCDKSSTQENKELESATPTIQESSSDSLSPESGCGSGTSPEPDCQPARKKVRTSYTHDQLKVLETQFQGNPYPDADRIETLSTELEIPESKLRIWFQNKRARWRRRVMKNPASHIMTMSPMMSQATPRDQLQSTPFMSSSPLQASHSVTPMQSQRLHGFDLSQETFRSYGNQIETNQRADHSDIGQRSPPLHLPSHSFITSPNYTAMTPYPQTNWVSNSYGPLPFSYSNPYGMFSLS